MKFLIAIKDQTYNSKNILEIGSRIAEAFSADLTIIYIGKKSRAMIEGDVNLTRKSLEEWNIYHPGLEILEWAFNMLKKLGFNEEKESLFSPKDIVEDKGRIRIVLSKSKNTKINLVLREGNLLSELNKEVEKEGYDITMIGSPKRKRMIHQLIQFLNTSIFIVKNFNSSWNYKILLCVDNSKATKRAIIYGARISKQFNSEIKIITVSNTSFIKSEFKIAHKWAEKYLKRFDKKCKFKFIIGRPVDVFVNEAKNDHIIIMGKSKSNEIFKFFKGSKPIHTAQLAKCPVLIVN